MMQRPSFSTTRMREGYSVDDVDAAVDRVMSALASEGQPAVSGEEIERLRFKPVRLGTGYDMGEVDAWLDTVVAELQRRRTTDAPPPAVAASPTPSTPDDVHWTVALRTGPLWRRVLVALAFVAGIVVVVYVNR